MNEFFSWIWGSISYNAERDFYGKIFPKLAERDDVYEFRRMGFSDFDAVTDIEKQVYDFPWGKDVFQDCFKANYLCWVYLQVGQVIAYGILSLGAGECHIMNLCVSPKAQNKGIGKRMLEKLIEEARNKQAETILLEVRPSNEAAVALYNKMGFDEIGLRKDYYPAKNGREDAIIFSKTLQNSQPIETNTL